MPTLAERVAYLEGKVEEHSKAWEDLRDNLNKVLWYNNYCCK